MTKPGRTPCEVLGCRRTAPADKYEPGTRICCGKCWRLGSKANRAAYRVAAKALKAAAPDSPEESAAERALDLAWSAVIREATEARAGIA